MVQQALELGAPVTGPQDVLFINWLVMGLSIVWDKSYLFYFAIPAYLIYNYGSMIKNYFFPPQMAVAAPDEQDAKRAAKKERQAARQSKFSGR